MRLIRIVNGQKMEQYLCEDCARDKGDLGLHPQSKFPFGNLLVGMLGQDWFPGPRRAGHEISACAACGLTHEEFARTGLLGCGECYQSFGSIVDPILRRVHGHHQHAGKIPERAGKAAATDRHIDDLRRELEDLVRREEFEEAAVLRDRIREIEGGSDPEMREG